MYACIATPPPFRSRLTNPGTAIIVTPASSWFTGLSLSYIRPALVQRAHVAGQTDLYSRLMIQTAAVRTDSPDDWAAVLSGGTPWLEVHGNNDLCPGSIDISSLLTNKMYARLGVGVLMTSAGAAASADVELALSLAQCGGVVANWSGSVLATGATPLVTPISRMLPALMVDRIRAGVSLSSVGQNLQLQLYQRTAATQQAAPGAWSAVTGTPTWDATTFETTSNDLTPSTSGKMWLQLGVGATLSSGTTPVTAMATVSAAARRV